MTEALFSPVLQPTLSSQVLHELRRQILHGQLPPLAPLRETQLAAALGVSRVPVREALLHLQRDGLVLQTASGALAPRAFVPSDPQQIADTRRQIEGRAASLAATEHTAADLAALQNNIAAFDAATSPEELARLDVEFHALLCEAAHQPWLVTAWSALRWPFHALLVRGFQKYVQATSLGDSKASTADHSRIVDAIRNRQAGDAETLIRQHIARWEEWLVAA